MFEQLKYRNKYLEAKKEVNHIGQINSSLSSVLRMRTIQLNKCKSMLKTKNLMICELEEKNRELVKIIKKDIKICKEPKRKIGVIIL